MINFKLFDEAASIEELSTYITEYDNSILDVKWTIEKSCNDKYGIPFNTWLSRNIQDINEGTEMTSVNEFALYEQQGERKDFGIPSMKKYPMPDKKHVLSAIKFFNYVDASHEKELATNINKKIKEYDMADEVHVGVKNRFSKYWKESVEFDTEGIEIQLAEAEFNEYDKLKKQFILADLDAHKTGKKLSTQVKIDNTIKRLMGKDPYPDAPRAIIYPNILPSCMVTYEGKDNWIKEFNELYTTCGIAAFSEQDMDTYYDKVKNAYVMNNINDLYGLGYNHIVGMPTSESAIKVGNIVASLSMRQALHGVNTYDMTHYNFPDEESLKEELSYEVDKKLYPVYIVLVKGNSPFSHAIRIVTQSEYTHASMGFESDLSELYSYNLVNGLKATGGVSFESLGGYINEYDQAKLCVGVVFLNAHQMRKMKNNIDYYVSHYKDTKYSVLNCLKVVLSPHIPNDAYALQMICSQFVTSMLKLVNIDITDGDKTKIMTPKDIRLTKNPKVYIVYEGLAKEYNKAKVDWKVKALQTYRKDNITVPLLVGEAGKYSPWQIQGDSYIIESIKEMVEPESIFVEKSLPVKFNDRGDLVVKTKEDIQKQYMEAHRNLAVYEEMPQNNTEGIKYELCRLTYLNSQLEKKISNAKGSKQKELIDIRARVLNDYKKYMKILLELAPDTNFAEVYRSSVYYDDEIEVDRKTIDTVISMMKGLL